MTNTGIAIDVRAATDWVRGSLAQGSTLAMLMTQCIGKFSKARVLVPEAAAIGRPVPDDNGRGIRSVEADDTAKSVLQRMARGGVDVMIVEDELARRGDVGLGPDVAFVEDRVLRWIEIKEHAEDAVALLRSGSSGYPLNAFGCRAAARELGLENGRELTADEQQLLIAFTDFVIVSVYDAEAYLIMITPNLASYLSE